jgi:PAS domain S-box-containing protein
MPTNSPPTKWLLRYCGALLAVAIAMFVRLALTSLVGPDLPTYITFYPAIMTAALLAGFGPGIVATAVAAFVVDFWVLPPLYSVKIDRASDAVGLAFFLGMGIYLSVVAELLRRSRQSAGAPDARPPLRESREPVGQNVLLALGLVASIGLLVAAAWLPFQQLRASAQADRAASHSYAVIQGLERLLSALIDMESGQRGLLITGEERYLEPYNTTAAALNQQLTDLDQLTQKDPLQHARAAKLRSLIEQKLAELSQTIELRRTQGLSAAAAVVLTDKGKLIMDQFRTQVTEAQTQEQQLRQTEIQARQSSASRAIQALLAGGLLGLLLVGTVFLFLYQENHRRRSAEAELERHRDRLQQMVEDRTKELHQTNESLRQQREWLAVTLSSIGDAVLAADTTGRVTFLNPAAARLTGYSPAQAQGQPASEVFRIINEQTHAPAEDIIGRVLREGHSLALANHTALLARDGREIPIEDSAAPIKDAAGTVTGVVIVFHNVTEKRRAIEAQARLAAVVQSSDDAIISEDLDGRILTWNEGAERLFGYRSEEVIGSPVTRLMPPEQQVQESDTLLRLCAGERIRRLETVRLNKTGQLLDVSVATWPIRNSDGKVVGASKLVHDISERKQAEQALRQSEQRVRLKLDSILEPEGDIGNLELADIIDVQSVQLLMEDLHSLAHIPMAIVDIKGKVLVGVGWQDICTQFHRVHPETCQYCLESDTVLSTGVAQGEFKLYRCKNSMWDVATPILVGGKHVGNLFVGQFFFEGESIDREQFRAQARRYGFGEDSYLAALDKVPRLSRPNLDRAMAYFSKLADMLSKLSYGNIKLARSLSEGQRKEAQLRLLSTAVESAVNGIAITDGNGVIEWVNPAFTRLTGYTAAQAVGQNPRLLNSGKHPPEFYRRMWATVLRGDPWHGELINRRSDGSLYTEEMTVTPVRAQGAPITHFVAIKQDVTQRKRAEGRVELLAETAGELLAAGSPQAVIERLCRKVLQFLDCQFFFNFLVDPAAGRLHLNACSGISDAQARNLEWLDFGSAICGCAARDACRIVAQDIQHTPDPRTELVKPLGVQAYACHPLIVQGRVLGTLSFGTSNRTKFDADELSLMKAVADQVAIALERQQTQAALKKANEELEHRVAIRTAALHAAERYARGLLEASLDPLVTISPDGKITDVNQATETVTGLHRRNLVGTSFSAYFTEPDKAEAGYQKVIADGLLRDYPLTVRHASGATTDVLYNAVVYRNVAGEAQGVFAAARDITALKAMESVLRDSEARYRSLVTASAQVVWTTDPQGAVTQQMPTWEAFTGHTFAQYQGGGWLNSLHPDDRAQTHAVWSRAVASRALYETEYRVLRRDGQYRHVLARGVPVLREDGSIREWVGTCTDITERRLAERRRDFTSALLALFAQKTTANDYLNSVVHAVHGWCGCQAVGIRVLNEKQQIPYESWVGFDPHFIELEHDRSLEREPCLCLHALNGALARIDPSLLTPTGSLRTDDALAFAKNLPADGLTPHPSHCINFGIKSLTVIPIRYREAAIGALHLADRRPGQFPLSSVEFLESMTPLIGEALHRFQTEAELARHRDHLEILVRDRTRALEAANAQLQVEIQERARAQETIQRTAEDLQRSNRDLEQFAYVASHDLQEPLRAVGGYVKLLRRRFPDQIDPKALEYISGAAEGAARMERLVRDLLAFSRVGTRGGDFTPTDTNQALRDALQNLQSSIQARQAAVTSDPLPTVPVDATQMTQLFQNLIGNALKFQSERPPEVQVSAKKQDARWVFSIRDNGIGIDPQYFERIFQIFQRLHTRTHYEGTGIGLAICKKIVERHGGTIWVESQPGQGSTFYFAFPQNRV